MSGSDLSGARRTVAITSTIITASQITAQMAMNIQIRFAKCSACGPCGSSADCQPAQPLKRRRAEGMIQDLDPEVMSWTQLGVKPVWRLVLFGGPGRRASPGWAYIWSCRDDATSLATNPPKART